MIERAPRRRAEPDTPVALPDRHPAFLPFGNGSEVYDKDGKYPKGHVVNTTRHTYDAYTCDGVKLGSGSLSDCFAMLDTLKARLAASEYRDAVKGRDGK